MTVHSVSCLRLSLAMKDTMPYRVMQTKDVPSLRKDSVKFMSIRSSPWNAASVTMRDGVRVLDAIERSNVIGGVQKGGVW